MRITYRFLVVSVVLLAALVLAACSPSPDTEDQSPIASPPAYTATPVASGDEEPDGVEAAQADLAAQLQIPADDIEVVSVEKVNWRDTSLGCPQEGEVYAQVIVPGQRIVLEAGGEEYTYHTGNGNVILCQDEESVGTAPTPEPERDSEEAALIEKAKQELSERADVAVDTITVQTFEAVQWRDSSLGCPKPGMQYLQVITPGYLIRLEADGEVYEYHTDQNNVVHCESPERTEDAEMSIAPELMAKVRADLASKTGVAEDEIQILETQIVEWSDSSLGCPQEGMQYLQVITPGYLIRLEAGGEEYEYHTSMTNIVLCEK